MAHRISWKGFLRVSIVAVPVRAYTAAASEQGRTHFNQLHEPPCNSRIRYQKTCPVHGEVSSDEIVLGVNVGEDNYVVVDPDEIEALRPEREKHSVFVDSFAPAGSVDPIYYGDKTYYLAPDGKVAYAPYQLIRDVMAEDGMEAVGQVVISSREQIVLVRPAGRLLTMTTLRYAAQVKTVDEFEDLVPDAEAGKKEMAAARQVIGGLTRKDIDIAEYKDVYQERLAELVEAKTQGHALVTPNEEGEEPRVLSFMDAIKTKVEQVKRPAKPKRKMAASRTSGTKAAGKKKSGRKTKKKTG
jgi:DNA end-binding protein Ku